MRSLLIIFATVVNTGMAYADSSYERSRHLGYSDANETGGYNPLCEADPICRKMSPNEIAFARTMFGDSIDYSLVNVFRHLPHDTTVPFAERAEIIAGVRYGNLYIPGYWYPHSLPDSFEDYGVEQQASIIQDLYVMRRAFNQSGRVTPSRLCNDIHRFENFVLPLNSAIGATPGCTTLSAKP